jgi:perosamine synthetase
LNQFVPVNEPLLNGNEKKYLIECIDSGWISSEGPFVEKFEEQFAKRVDRTYAIAVTNGTAAIDVAIEALRLEPGDEVILPAFTIISCITHIVRSGLKPVLVDSDPDTWNMNISEVEAKITNRTRAILMVHIYGLPVDVDKILSIADKHKLYVIEDAAEMHGQLYKGKPCGSFGDISTFSFYPNKHLTTGEGGMLVTNSAELAERCRSLRNLCFQPEKRFVHERLGWNLRMTNMQAALGCAQLERLDEFVAIKREMGRFYTNALADITCVDKPKPKTDYADNIYWVFGIVLRDQTQMKSADAMRMLGSAGIGTRPFFCPMHMQPILQKMGYFMNETYPVAENLYENGFYLPSGLALTLDQMNKVSTEMHKIFRQ